MRKRFLIQKGQILPDLYVKFQIVICGVVSYPVNAFSSEQPMPRNVRPSSERSKVLMDIRHVAERAKVSIATVSRTINRNPTVNPKMAKRVWDAIRELGYYPNTQARALGSGRSGIFGLIVSDITNPFFAELIQGFEDVAVESGYEILVSSTNYDPRRMELCIRRMLERKAEGVAVMTFGIDQPIFERLIERKVPLVFVDAGPDRPGISLLKVDYHNGIRQGVQHLAALGHRRIAFISGPPDLHSAQARVSAFTRSLTECGIGVEPGWIVPGNHILEGGMAAAEKLLSVDQRPTAIMCSNDMTAIGVLHHAYRSHLHIPKDISLIGYDDIQMARMVIPPLTSIRMSRTDLATTAVYALRAHVEGRVQEREYKINTQLVVRESTNFPPGSMTDLQQPRHSKE
jgi:DNA-binding LacI/PurR family transcriptional regulator